MLLVSSSNWWFIVLRFLFDGNQAQVAGPGLLHLKQKPLQQWRLLVQGLPLGLHLPASALFASPKQASAMPARPTPNFFSAARRVTDWAMFLVSSSNWLFILFLSCLGVLSLRAQLLTF
jgi:hypothetical protein